MATLTRPSTFPSETIVTTTDKQDVADELQRLATMSAIVSGASDVTVEPVKSFYWWEGKVAADDEIRLSFDTSAMIEVAEAILAPAHNYDVPMIIGHLNAANAKEFVSQHAGAAYPHWRGDVRGADAELAEKLVKSRNVACAQLAGDGQLAVKTVAAARYAIEAQIAPRSIIWTPISGTAAYTEWLSKETRA